MPDQIIAKSLVEYGVLGTALLLAIITIIALWKYTLKLQSDILIAKDSHINDLKQISKEQTTANTETATNLRLLNEKISTARQGS